MRSFLNMFIKTREGVIFMMLGRKVPNNPGRT